MTTPAERLIALLSKMNDRELTANFNEVDRQFEIVFTDDRGSSRPFRMPIQPDELWDRIQLPESDRDALWPDVSVEEASLRLFSIHLLEAVMTAKEGADVLVKEPGGIRAVHGDSKTEP